MSRVYHSIALVSLSTCTTLLEEDFDSYANVGVPGCAIPGQPSCESVDTQGMDVQFIVSQTNALSGSKSLSFEPGFPGEDSVIEFQPCSSVASAGSLIFKWQGRLESGSNAEGVSVRIVDAEDQIFRSFLLFDIKPASMEIRSGGDLIDTIDGNFRSKHTIIARIKPGLDKYYILILNDDEQSLDGNLSDVVDFTPDDVVLKMEWQAGNSVSSVYRVDEVSISQRLE